MASLLVLLALIGVAAGSVPEKLYRATPVGHILSHCVHQVPEGTHISTTDDGATTVRFPNGTSRQIPACDTLNGTLPLRVRDIPLPADYDGWLQYTAVNTSKLGLTGGFDGFSNVMSVPQVPKRRPQILYLFPGLQNMDWIPNVDPEPTAPFDILQPVLQFPGGFFSNSWVLKSWYVTVNSGAIESDGISIDSGDDVVCNMTRTGPQDWVVVGTRRSDGKATTQKASNSRLKLQPWAYNTVECYGCDGCDTYPVDSVRFTENKLYQAGKELQVPGDMWDINPKPAKKLMCHEKTTVAANGDTTVSFQ